MIPRCTRLLLATLVTLSACETSPPAIPLREAPAAYAAAYCERLFDCCAAGEVAITLPGAGITDVASCEAHIARVFGNEFIDDTQRAMAMDMASYDPTALTSCLDQLRAEACPQLARVFRLTVFPAECPPVRIPKVAIGDACDHDFQCESDLCAGGGEMQIGRCEQRPAIGAACVDGQCTAGAYCSRASSQVGTCAPLGQDGVACTGPFDCASFACIGASPGSSGTCGAPTTCVGGG